MCTFLEHKNISLAESIIVSSAVSPVLDKNRIHYNHMSSYILKTVRSDAVSNWVKVNAAGSVKGTPKDSWRAYLAANSGTGSTLADQERNFLRAATAVGSTLHDLWGDYLGRVLSQAGSTTKEKARNKYQ